MCKFMGKELRSKLKNAPPSISPSLHLSISGRLIVSETIKVYDGYNSLRKRMFRTVTVNKHCSKDELLLAAMRAFVVTQVRRTLFH